MSLLACLGFGRAPRPFTTLTSLVLFACLGSSVVLSGCQIFSTTCKEDDRTCLSGGIKRVGDKCDRNGDCASGLDCNSGVCEYSGSTPKGSSCRATAECGEGLFCDIQQDCASKNPVPSSCQPACEKISADAQDEGGACGTTADCKRGLVCDAEVATLFTEGPFDKLPDDCKNMLSAASDEIPEACQLPKKCVKRGTKDTGAACKTNADCLAGLFCYDVPKIDLEHPEVKTDETEKVCVGSPQATQQEPISIPTWDGVACPKDDKTPTAYFEVPGVTEKDNDFFRLPFPNDVRKKNGKVDLTGFGTPPSDTGVPVVERFVSAASTVLDGFATNPVIYFRFSEPINASNSSLSGTSVRIVDISKGSPSYDSLANIEWSPSGLHSNYICDNWLAIRRPIGEPLRPGTTYVAFLTRQVKTAKGLAFARGRDMDAMLASSAPSDAKLAAAYAAYQPVRDWIADTGYDGDSILTAAVFTTQQPEAVMPALHQAVADDGAPKLEKMVVCKAGVTLPECEDETGRGACHAENADYTEVHGIVSLPIFQKGTPPYEKPEQGGEIAFEGGKAIVQSHMDVCFAMSVPKAAAPKAGYPVMLYAHGTGGSFSGQMASGGLAKDVATGATPGVLFAIDMPEHGNRRGDSKRPPEDLFFNFLNPQGAYGNVLQGSADMLSLSLLVRSGPISVSGLGDVKLDASRVVFFGHSQGATHSAIALPFEGGAAGGILSGVGGHLATSLLSKKKPVDIGSILPFVLFDADSKGKLVGGTYNPVLAIVQMFFEGADPINYAHHYKKDPTDSAPTGHHLFMTYGLLDSYAPEPTQAAYAKAASLTLVAPALTDINLDSSPAPLSDNATVGGTMRTVGMRQYDPMGMVDGHFVSTETAAGRKDVVQFFQQIMNGEEPQIGQ